MHDLCERGRDIAGTIQPAVRHLFVFQREPGWVMP
jgi:hypothetical protein